MAFHVVNGENGRKAICWIIDIIAVQSNKHVVEKEKEKVDKYQDLKHEIVHLWESRKAKVIYVVTGPLGMVTEMLQKTALLGTARIIKRVM